MKSATGTSSNKKHPEEFIQERVSIVASELLSQVHLGMSCWISIFLVGILFAIWKSSYDVL
jgi:hypothetical protein